MRRVLRLVGLRGLVDQPSFAAVRRAASQASASVQSSSLVGQLLEALQFSDLIEQRFALLGGGFAETAVD